MNVIKQILREFWFPFLVASMWTAYIVRGGAVTIETVVPAFGPAFFLASWLTGQYFRIRKQEHVQVGLTNVQDKMQSIVQQLEHHTDAIVNYTTGGNSFCYFAIGVVGDYATWTLIHVGDYPIYDVNVRIVNLFILANAARDHTPIFAADTNFEVGTLAPTQGKVLWTMNLVEEEAQAFNVFFSARNGFYVQQIRFRQANGRWVYASVANHRSDKLTTPIYSQIDPDYPVDINGNPVDIELQKDR